MVGCASGVYVALRSEFGTSRSSLLLHLQAYVYFGTDAPRAEYTKVLNLANPTSMLALAGANKLLVLSDHFLYAYALDVVARVAAGAATTEHLEAGRQVVAGQDSGVQFFRAGRIGSRNMSACSPPSPFLEWLTR